MKLIVSDLGSAAEHLGLEEVLLRETDEDWCLLYRNTDCVVIGRHQNLPAEVNLAYAWESGLPIWRRSSGGGAVYHDRGTLNFAFIRELHDAREINFGWGLERIQASLKALGLCVELRGRSDLYAGDRKVSGNAMRLHRSRSLHHGTLLFDTRLDHLREALAVDEREFSGRAVASRRAPVANLRALLDDRPTTQVFWPQLAHHLEKHQGWERADVPKDLWLRAKVLAQQQFTREEWIWGNSPASVLTRSFSLAGRIHRWKVRLVEGRMVENELEPPLPTPFHNIERSWEGHYLAPLPLRNALQGRGTEDEVKALLTGLLGQGIQTQTAENQGKETRKKSRPPARCDQQAQNLT